MDGDLLERGTALAAIDEVVEGARAGAGAVLLLEAHPGLGKTRLTEVTADRCRTLDLRVLGAAGAALEQDLGWGVARGVFGGELGDPARRARRPPRSCTACTGCCPTWRRRDRP